MSDKVVCSRCGLSEDYIDDEVIDPVEGLRHVTVLPPNWKRFVWETPKFLCPECCNKLDAFFGIKPKNLAKEFLLLVNSKKEFNDNEFKKYFNAMCKNLKTLAKFNAMCKNLKTLAKDGKTETKISISKNMINLFREHGFIVDILSDSLINDGYYCRISWGKF